MGPSASLSAMLSRTQAKMRRCCILLKDVWLEEERSQSGKSSALDLELRAAARGELLEPANTERQLRSAGSSSYELQEIGTMHLALTRAPGTEVECKDEDVSWLSETEAEILAAVSDAEIRYAEFCSGDTVGGTGSRLRWARGLRAGRRVRVRLSDEATGAPHYAEGVLRYAGHVGKKLRERVFGVEITVSPETVFYTWSEIDTTWRLHNEQHHLLRCMRL